jgi:3-hydroxyisobutyrate dehydrogenase-like beta-hydroxyacid dehydrogenase
MAVNPAVRNVGFVGLGQMGGAIARAIHTAGFPLSVYDIRHEATLPFETLGAKVADSLAALAADSDVIGICVLDDDQLLEVTLGTEGVVENARDNALIIVFSTVTPQTVQQIGSAAHERGVRIIDAPVIGLNRQSLEGTLTMMVGGATADVERARPVLDAAGTNVVHVGTELGSGEVAKLCHNMNANSNIAIILEAIKLAGAYGITEEKLLTALDAGAGVWFVQNWSVVDYQLETHTLAASGGVPYLLSKDAWDAVLAARAKGLDLPATAMSSIMVRQLVGERGAAKRSTGALDS